MSNGRDEIDSWLEREVTPLMPPSGTLDRIRHRAKRRKTTQALMAAAGCAVVIAAGVVVPQLTGGLQQNSGHGIAPQAGHSLTPASVRPSHSRATESPASNSSSPLPQTTHQHSHLSATTSGTLPPPSFLPTSVTFAGTGTGAVVGAVIGQAGNASHPCATQYCTSLAGTSTYGKSWYGVSAPLTGGPDSVTGVSQLRFLDLSHGWAFGPGLWETSNGGWPWAREDTHGMRVTDLETAGGRAFAIFASCAGTGKDYTADCTSFSLYSSLAGSTTWTPVDVPAAFRQMTTSVPSAAALVIGGKTGYLLTPSGAVLSGPVAGGAWKLAGQAPCKPDGAQASGLPTGAQLAAGQTLVLACDGSSTAQVYLSYGTMQWKHLFPAQIAGTATSVAAAQPGQGHIVLATTAGLYYTMDAGALWKAAAVTSEPAGGFSYVGMTNATQGVAVPSDSSLGEIFVTSDGGATWTRSPIKGS